MRDVNNARCHNKSVRPSSLLSLPAPSRFMTLAYSFAASLAGRRTQRRAGRREEGRDGLGGQCEHRYLCVRRCGSRSPRPPFPRLSAPVFETHWERARRGRDGPHSGWVDPQKRRADHGRRTDLSRRSPADAFLARARPRFLPPSFWALPSFSLPFEGPPTSDCVRQAVFPYLFRHPGRASPPLRPTSGRTSARPLPPLSPSLK